MSVDPSTRAEIDNLNARFAWALDRHDWAMLEDVLAPDVRYSSIGRDLRGASAVIRSFRSRPEGRTTRHGRGNLLLVAGPMGSVIGRGSWHTFASNGPTNHVPLFMVADFDDTYTRDDSGAWRISERVITAVFRDAALAPGEVGSHGD